MEYYVGIDIGTSSAKLTLVNGAGNIIAESSRGYAGKEPKPGWKEIDPEVWMSAVNYAMEELLKGQDSARVKGIGVTGQMHTVVVLGADGQPVRPALMWNDTRTSGILGNVKKKIREHPQVSYIANIISTGSPAMNLLWMKENEPENFRNIHKFLIGPDYIVYRLTGRIQTDYCEASTSSLFDLKQGKWSSEIRSMLGLPEDIYPEVRGTSEVAGTLLDIWKEKYAFPEEVKVLVGTGDNPAAAIATGCFAGKYPVLSLGTSGILMHPKDGLNLQEKGKHILFSFDGKERMVLVQGAVQSCGSSLDWWMGKVLESSNFEKETQIDMDRLGESSILFYPHLAGDKTIYADAQIRGAFLGIGTDTSRVDMTIAVMEGICLAIRQLAENMEIPKENLHGLRVIGGGSKNPVWMQILADVLNVSVCRAEGESGAGYGIALTAARGIGKAAMEELPEKDAAVSQVFAPREYQVKLYQKKYLTYLRVYGAVKRIFEGEGI